MASVEQLCKDLDDKMDELKSRQSRRDQYIASKTGQNTDGGSAGGHTDTGQDIYIGNIPVGLSDDELKSTFAEYAPIRARVLNHGNGYNYGFVRFANMMQAKNAAMAFNGLRMKGNLLSVRLVRDHSRARIMEEGVTRGLSRTEPDRALIIHVGNVSLDTTQEDITQLFAEYGGISKLTVYLTRDGNRQYARVTMRSEALLRQAIQELNGTFFHGTTISLAVYKVFFNPQPRINGTNAINKGGHTHGGSLQRPPQQNTSGAINCARRLVQKIEVLSSEVLDNCEFCQRIQGLIHELQTVLDGIGREGGGQVP